MPNNSTNENLPTQLQYQAEIVSGNLIKKQGFFFPGIRFFYAEHNANSALKNAIKVEFTRNSNNIHLVNYAFYTKQEEEQQEEMQPLKNMNSNFNKQYINSATKAKYNSAPFLLLFHPDYAKETTPGIYQSIAKLSSNEYLAAAVLTFLAVTKEVNTLKHFKNVGFPVGLANTENNAKPTQSNTANEKMPSFTVWQPKLVL